MTIRYVGQGGSDAASGLTWALRKETLNGVEDTPVEAGDIIYVGPGTYREQLTVDVTGSSGNIITYIGDTTGENTDGVGGEVRITGSDDDKTESRAVGIYFNAVRDYRTFCGFRFDMCSTACIHLLSAGFDNLVIEDCSFFPSIIDQRSIWIESPPSGETFTIDRCFFISFGDSIHMTNISAIPVSGLIQNCVFFQSAGSGIKGRYVYGWTAKNCSFMSPGSSSGGESIDTSAISVMFMGASDASYAYNCVFSQKRIYAQTSGMLVEDYCFYDPITSDAQMRINVTKGANSNTGNVFLLPMPLIEGFYFAPNSLDVASWSPLTNLACGQSPPSVDIYGLARPSVDLKKTRGAIQYQGLERETTIVPSGASESIEMPDAAVHPIFIPITGKKMNFSVEAYREANYAGTLPQMVIKQPGQADRITTDTGSSGQFNDLADSFTPANSPSYVVMEIRSNNTAVAGSYATYFGNFEVT